MQELTGPAPTNGSVDVTVCIVNWNTRDLLDRCVSSLYRYSRRVRWEAVVVDNASTDGSQDMVRRKHPGIRVVDLKENVGFAKASNIGLSLAAGRNILFLNPDTEVTSDVVSDLSELLDGDQRFGAVGCKLIWPDGRIQLTCAATYPGVWNTFCEGLLLHRFARKCPYFSSRSLEHWDHNSDRWVDCISGAFLFSRASLIRSLEGFNEEFFMYGEDLDLCRRIQGSGFKIFYQSSHTVIHHSGAASKQQGRDFSRLKQFEANAKFLSRHFGKRKAQVYRMVFAATGLCRLIGVTLFYPFLLLVKHDLGPHLRSLVTLLKQVLTIRFAD